MKKYIFFSMILVLLVATIAVAKEKPEDQPFKAILNAINKIQESINRIEKSINNKNLLLVYAGVPKTGQTQTWEHGDDGDLQRGIEWPNPRFTNNQNGTATDNMTGLVWMVNADCFGQKIWTEALSACNALSSGSCGLTDNSIAGNWRLPNVREFLSIIDFGKVDPALPTGYPFQNVRVSSVLYWTSTTDQTYDVDAWFIHMLSGYLYNEGKSSANFVWCVRDNH